LLLHVLLLPALFAVVYRSKRLPRISYGSGGSGPGSDSVSEWVADPSELLSSGAAGASATKRQAFLDGEDGNVLVLAVACDAHLSTCHAFLGQQQFQAFQMSSFHRP
jgi:hypothetical protein